LTIATPTDESVGVATIIYNCKFWTMYPTGLLTSSEALCCPTHEPLLSVQNQHHPGEYATTKVNVVVVDDYHDVLETINLASPWIIRR